MATPAPKKGIKLKVGDRVVVTGLVGTIRFIGLTKFAPDKWVGVELDKPEGKNDGSVKGVKYFTCQQKYGLFAKPTMVRPYKEGQPEGDDGGEVDFDDAPEKPPAAPVPAVAPVVAPATAPKISAPSAGIKPPASPAAKPVPAAAAAAPAAAAPSPAAASSSTSAGEKSTSQLVEEKREALKKIKEKQDALASDKRSSVTLSAPPASAPTAPSPVKSPTAAPKSSAEEKKLQEDLANAQREIERLKKLSGEAKDVPALRKQIADLTTSNEKLKKDKEAADDKVLYLTQDMELANEELSLVKMDLEELKSQKDGNREQILSSLPADQAGLARLNEQNNQLQAALRKLRDKYTEDKQAADDFRTEAEATIATLKQKAAKLAAAEEQLADLKDANETLKSQLEESGEHEKMVEKLTEQQGDLEAEIKKLRDEAGSLHALKQMADEAEEVHIDLENQLQAELESKDAEIQECHRQLKLKQTLIEDLNATQRQFRDLVRVLENENRELRAQNDTAQGISKDESERARKARIANLQLQSKVSEVRNKSVEHALAKLEAQEAQTRIAFYESHIPDNVNIDNAALSFLLTLDRLRLKASSLAKLFADSYGINTHNETLAHFTYDICSRLSDLAKAVDTLKFCVQKNQDEDLFLKLVGEREALRSPEAVLDEFFQMLLKDTFNEATPLQALQGAEENIAGFLAGYFMGDEDERGQRRLKFPVPLSLSHDVARLHYQQAVVATYFQALADIVSTSLKSKDGAPNQAVLQSLEQLQQVAAANSDISSHLLTQATSYQVLAQGRGVTGAAFDTDVKTCSSSIFACLVRAKQLFEWTNDLVRRGVDDSNYALISEQIETRLATEKAERRLMTELTAAQMALRDLRARLETVAEGKEESRASTVWERRAGAVRQDLLQAASLQAALEEVTKKSEEKARELFLTQKRARDLQAKVDVITQQLEVVRGKADDSAEARMEGEKLRRRVGELETANEQLSKDLEQSSEAGKTLRKKVLKLKFEVKQAKEAGGGPRAGPGDGVALLSGKAVSSLQAAAAEINLLLRTIAVLRHQLAQQRAHTQQVLTHAELPPLPVVHAHVVAAATSEAGAAQLAHLQLFAPATKAEVQTVQTLGEELASVGAKANLMRAAATLVDVSSAHSAGNATQQWLATQAEAFKIKADTAALRDRLSSFLASKQSQSFRSLFASTPTPAAAVPGAANSTLIARVVIPGAGGAAPIRTVVDHADFQKLHSIFLN